MKDIMEVARQIQEDAARVRDPLGLGRMQHLGLDHDLSYRSLGMNERLLDSFSHHDRITAGSISGMSHMFQAESAITRMVTDMNRLMEPSRHLLEMTRAYEAQSSLTSIIADAARLVGAERWQFSEIYKQIGSVTISSAFAKQFEFAADLDRQIRQLAPLAFGHWNQELLGLNMPWMSMHQAMLPHAPLLLRAIEEPGRFGIASWLDDEGDDDVKLGLAAITPERVVGARNIIIKAQIRCALCDEPMFDASKTYSWVGAVLMITIDAVPVCGSCSRREAEEPGSFNEALQEFLTNQAPEGRLQLQVMDGENSDPVPCGVLTLVNEEHHDEEGGPDE